MSQDDVERWLSALVIYVKASIDNRPISEELVMECYAIYNRCHELGNKASEIAKANLDDPTYKIPLLIMILAHLQEIDKILRSNEKIVSIAAQVGL